MAGQVAKTLSELAQELLDWFQEAHPGDAAMTLNEVEDHIRETWYRGHELIRNG